MKKIKKISVYTSSVLGILIAGFLILAWSINYHPSPIEEVAVQCSENAPGIKQNAQLKVLNWNIQFLGGRQYHFFYSGGQDSRPSPDAIETTAKGIATILQRENPDIVLLQEVDENAARTDFSDQTKLLLEKLPENVYPCRAETFYWKSAYIPHPQISGRVGMKLVTLSKYAITSARRLSLPQIVSQDFLTRWFYLKRAVLETTFKQTDNKTFIALNTHLDAFAQGDDTMQRQVMFIRNLLEEHDSNGSTWIIGGDFNLLPGKFQYEELSPEERKYYNPESELKFLTEKYNAIPSKNDLTSNEKQSWFTAVTDHPDQKKPNRTIDYIFYSSSLVRKESKVLGETTAVISDHAPIVATFQFEKP